VSLDPIKWTFSGGYISAIKGVLRLKFLHMIEIDQGLLAYTQKGMGSPKSNREKFTFGLSL